MALIAITVHRNFPSIIFPSRTKAQTNLLPTYAPIVSAKLQTSKELPTYEMITKESNGASTKLRSRPVLTLLKMAIPCKKKTAFTGTSEGGNELCPVIGFVFQVVY